MKIISVGMNQNLKSNKLEILQSNVKKILSILDPEGLFWLINPIVKILLRTLTQHLTIFGFLLHFFIERADSD